MRKDFTIEIEIPAGINTEINNGKIIMEKDGTKVEREFKGINLKLDGNKIKIQEKGATKRKKKIINSIKAHIKNMIEGLEKKFVYKLQICFVHFPSTVEIKENEVLIKNFLGETTPRKAKIFGGASVKKQENFLIVESSNKEAAGQTAANIEKATKIKNRDRRIFQDGVYIVESPGRKK